MSKQQFRTRNGILLEYEPEPQLPPEILAKVPTAKLPENYVAAKAALEACASVDECLSWDDVSALASYARQAGDAELADHARRIRARAARRIGELLLKFDARGGDRSKNQPPQTFAPSRTQVAQAAGLSRHERIVAVRIAKLPSEQFETLVDGPEPPGTAALARLAVAPRAIADAPRLITADDVQSTRANRIVDKDCDSLLALEFDVVQCDFEKLVEKIVNLPPNRQAMIRTALNFAMRLKDRFETLQLGGEAINRHETQH